MRTALLQVLRSRELLLRADLRRHLSACWANRDGWKAYKPLPWWYGRRRERCSYKMLMFPAGRDWRTVLPSELVEVEVVYWLLEVTPWKSAYFPSKDATKGWFDCACGRTFNYVLGGPLYCPRCQPDRRMNDVV